MRVLAVDFGTSNTVAALGVDGGAPRLVTIDGSPLVPSSVFLADDGTLAVGRDADRQARIDPSRYEPNPKRRIDDGFILLGTSALPVTTAIAEVLKRVAGEVRRQLGAEPDQVRLTHPARWGQRRRDTLVAAAAEAGLGRDPVLIPEPVAAATHFATLTGSGTGVPPGSGTGVPPGSGTGVPPGSGAGVPPGSGAGVPPGSAAGGGLRDGQALAVYDLGGGTFDIAVVARRGGDYEVLAEAGLPDLGGLDFDHAITEHIGSTRAGELDPASWQRLLRPTDAASRRQARVLATDVRDGKEALSRYPHVDIALPPPFPDVHLTRAEFEDLIRPNLQRSVDLMARTIADAGFAPQQLAGVYLVGGSSRIPLVARLIQQGLGITPTTLDQPETSVVTGALYLPLGTQAPAAAGPVAPQAGGGPSQGGPVQTGPAQPGGYPMMPPYQPGYPSGPQRVPGGPVGVATGFQQQGPPSGQQPAVTGPPSGGQPAVGYPSGGQPAVPAGLPALNLYSAVPPGQVRPLTGPGGPGGPVGPGGPGGGPGGPGGGPGGPGGRGGPTAPHRPPGFAGRDRPKRGNGRLVGVAAAVVLVVVLTTVGIVYATRGGSPGPAPTASGSTSAAGSQFDQFFADDTVRDYVAPRFDEVQSCARGFAAGSATPSTALPSATTCTYKNGVQVAFAKAGDQSQIDLLRDTIAQYLPAVQLTPKKGDWSGGHIDEYTGASLNALYWDDRETTIYAFGAVDASRMNIAQLRQWWGERFGR